MIGDVRLLLLEREGDVLSYDRPRQIRSDRVFAKDLPNQFA